MIIRFEKYRLYQLSMLICLMVMGLNYSLRAQKISTSPTRINYKVSPGASGRSRITVANNSAQRQGFQMSFGDFVTSSKVNGKGKFSDQGTQERSCAQWLSATPSVFELEPGETQEITVLMDVPADSSALIARWAVAYVQLRAPDNDGKDSGSGLKVQVNQTYRFGVYIFQTPPSASSPRGEIVDLNYADNLFSVHMKNESETFLTCNSYIELTSLETGETQRISTRGFTILPSLTRESVFQIPETLIPGRYSVLAVMDYGNRDEVEAAEMEITVPKREN